MDNDKVLQLIGRDTPLFSADIDRLETYLSECIAESRFLIIGGAGSIGQAVATEIFRRNPAVLHVVDVSENNLVELVRNLRSTIGYQDGDFKTFSVDAGGMEFEALVSREGPYDYVFNLSALKHVRSERDPYTLSRMIEVNIFNTVKSVQIARRQNAKNYFVVSTDKAANPVNLMGASKRVMEKFVVHESRSQNVSMARFANVAFSDGSLLHGFSQRIAKNQPISAPRDVKRYFITQQESGELCMLSGLMGRNRDVFFPQLSEGLDLLTFSSIAKKFITDYGYEPYECETEEHARSAASDLIAKGKWPCYFFDSNTTGEKAYEEFYTDNERVDLNTFESVGIIKNELDYDEDSLMDFKMAISKLRASAHWDKEQIIRIFERILPELSHHETGRYLDQRM